MRPIKRLIDPSISRIPCFNRWRLPYGEDILSHRIAGIYIIIENDYITISSITLLHNYSISIRHSIPYLYLHNNHDIFRSHVHDFDVIPYVQYNDIYNSYKIRKPTEWAITILWYFFFISFHFLNFLISQLHQHLNMSKSSKNPKNPKMAKNGQKS